MSLPAFHFVSIPTAPTLTCPPPSTHSRSSKITAVVRQTHAAARAEQWTAPTFEVVIAPRTERSVLKQVRPLEWMLCAESEPIGLMEDDSNAPLGSLNYKRVQIDDRNLPSILALCGRKRVGYVEWMLSQGRLTPLEVEIVKDAQQKRVMLPGLRDGAVKHLPHRCAACQMHVTNRHKCAATMLVGRKPEAEINNRYVCASDTTWLADDKFAVERDRLLDSDGLTINQEIADNVLMMEPQEAVLFVKAHIRLQTEQRMAAKGCAQARYFAEIFSDIKRAFLKFAPRRALQC